MAAALVFSLFLGHASCSVVLILLNKTISSAIPFPWTIVCMQNLGTLLGCFSLHVLGKTSITALPQGSRRYVLIDAVWLVVVLWSSLRALEYVSVPLYVVARNTVPMQTAVVEHIFLGTPVDRTLCVSLIATFSGTILYSMHDFSTEMSGFLYAAANTLLVATMCVYEKALMTRLKKDMSPTVLNFHRVICSMPLVFAMMYYEGAAQPVALLSEQPRTLMFVLITSAAAFGIGSLLFTLQLYVSPTTIQVANLLYKFVTTLISRFTHPADVPPLGWVGYAICTSGFALYSWNEQAKKREVAKSS